MKKTPKNIILFLHGFLLMFAYTFDANCQSIVIGTPSLGFSQACASSGFNTYNVTFTFFPASNLQAGNTFNIEMSDATGSFASPTVVGSSTATTSPVNTSFSIPTTSAGSAYRIRIKSTAPVATSPVSAAFSAYYAIHNQPFSINANVGTVAVCEGSNFSLSIDNTGTPSSPLFYPHLTYIWYRNFIEIPNQNGPTIPINQSGNYYAIVNYGNCVMNSYSNIVTVNMISGFELSINSTQDFICAGSTQTITSSHTDPSFSYQWYKDGIAIVGATNAAYAASQEGVYHLIISVGGCTFESNPLFLELRDLDVFVDANPIEILIPGTQLIINSFNNATNPSYQWKRNGVNISGATSANYTVTEAGTYEITVTENSGCALSATETVVVEYPTSYDIEINTGSDFTSCVSTSTTLSIVSFNAYWANGNTSILNNNYGYNYQWFKNNVAISGANTTSLNLSNSEQNGDYHIEVSIPGTGSPVVSNIITIVLAQPSAVLISMDNPYCNNTTFVTLESNFSNPSYDYQWYLNNTLLVGETQETLTTNIEGNYHLVIEIDGCSYQSNTIILETVVLTASIDANAIEVLIPGTTLNITITDNASNPSYTWQKDGDILAGENNNTLAIVAEGAYEVIVTDIDNCNITETASITVIYPSSYEILINTSGDYTSCLSTNTELTITNFNAFWFNGSANILNNNYGYSYQWYKDNVAISGANNTSLNINDSNENGTYHLEVIIPGMTDVIVSNTISVVLANTTPLNISQNGIYCDENTFVTFESNFTGSSYNYQWYLNGIIITGETQETLTTNTEGNYHLVITEGACVKTSNTLSIGALFGSVTILNPDNDIIIPGAQKILTATTTFGTATYQWYRNDIAIAGATNLTYTATLDGTYKIIVTQTGVCPITAEDSVMLTYPNNFVITIAVAPGYVSCSNTPTSINVINFLAETNNGNISLDANDPMFNLQWRLNNNPVAGETNSSIAITNASQNGSYNIAVSLPDYGIIVSNNISIALNIVAPIITVNGTICGTNPVILTSSVTDPLYTYNWYFNGTLIPGANNVSYNASEPGSYYVAVSHSSCTANAIPVNVTETTIEASLNVPEIDLIVPGENKTLTVSTNAINPSYQWYKDNILIPGATAATYNATVFGTYKVVVFQNNDCPASQEVVVNLIYPNTFDIIIAPDANFNPCESVSTTLQITVFDAISTLGTFSILNNDYGYVYQWYKDNVLLQSGSDISLLLNNVNDNGTYELRVVIPEFNLMYSNTVVINLGLAETFTITASSEFICPNGDSIDLMVANFNPSYTYNWYRIGTANSIGTGHDLTINNAGTYYVEIINNGCTYYSNEVTIIPYAEDSVTLSEASSINLFEGTTITVYAYGAESYQWFFNGQLIQTGDSIVISEEGVYTLLAMAGTCEVIKTITVTKITNTSIVVPNVVTRNGDGRNDYWAIPEEFANRDNVEVVIYSTTGQVLFRTRNYINNWPNSDYVINKREPVVYYVITVDEVIVKRGSITIID